MGCAAVCGSSSSVAENNKEWEALFLALLAQTTPNPFLYPQKQLVSFKKQTELSPHRSTLILPEKLQQNSSIPPAITEKWKILLFTLDLCQSKYIECLGYLHQYTKNTNTNILEQNNQSQNCQKSNSNRSENSCQKKKQHVVDILPHKVFTQIHKDIERTFPNIQFNHEHFTNILKRISNTFPVMGYTQGINFLVGYLLIIGYSELDTYYLFLHLALNRRYFILGFYQDNFPLINVFIHIFRNILKRTNQKLYNHLYHKVEMLQQSIWVFKWFMTFYLSSFPIEMCMYVFDFLLCTDSTALIKFAIGLIGELEEQLMEYDDACDIAQFFDEMKDINRFNQLVDIRGVIRAAYRVNIEKEDLRGLDGLGAGGNDQGEKIPNFYAQYLGVRFGEVFAESSTRTPDSYENQDKGNSNSDNTHHRRLIENKKSMKESFDLLDTWYSKLTEQRQQFFHQSPLEVPDSKVQPQKEEVQVQTTNLTQSIIIIQPLQFQSSSPSTLPLPNPNLTVNTNANIQGEIRMKVKNSFSRCSIKKYIKEQSVCSWNNQQEEQYKEENQDKMEMDDDLFYMAKDIRFKRKKVSEPSDILSEYSNPEQNENRARKNNNSQSRHNIIPRNDQLREQFPTKVNSISAGINSHNINDTCSRLAYVGNSIISNFSGSNSNRSSTSSFKANHGSHNGNFQKENGGVKNEKIKNRTQQNYLGISLGLGRKGERSDLDNQGFGRDEKYEQSADVNLNVRKRLSIQSDWIINSQGPHEKSNNLVLSNVKQMSDAGSEVQIKGIHMFKKKNRVNADFSHKQKDQQQKKNGERESSGEVGRVLRHENESQSNLKFKQLSKVNGFNDEESCESVFIGNVSSLKSQICEVDRAK